MASPNMASPKCSSPSSSAVTIPRPGKSILKKPPPPQQSFFSLSRLSRLLPTQNHQSTSSTFASFTSANGNKSNANANNGNGNANGTNSNNGGNGSSGNSGNDSNKDDIHNNANNNKPDPNLKRAHFFLPHLATVYPISAGNPPSSAYTKEEKRTVEAREAERRRRIVRGNSTGPGGADTEEWWSMEKVESFYQECCVGREEEVHVGISGALKKASGKQDRTLDLSGIQITLGQAAVLSDVFSVEWGLRKLFLKECDLDEHVLKPILHSLLIPGTLNFLSVASNRKLKAPSFRLIGAFVQKSKNLQFLDLSQNMMDKKSVEYIGNALRPASEAGLVSLRMDDCSLRPASLELLAQSVRTSSLRNISLRHNRISASGAVALALMIKDYPDTMPASTIPSNSSSNNSSSTSSPISTTASSLFSTLSPPLTPLSPSPPMTPTQQLLGLYPHSQSQTLSQASPSGSPRSSVVLPPPPRQGPIPPPPIHPSNAPVQTTYTPYIPRARRAAAAAAAAIVSGATANARAVQHASYAPNPLAANGQQVPIITSSAQGGVTMRHPVVGQMTNGIGTGVGASGGGSGSGSGSGSGLGLGSGAGVGAGSSSVTSSKLAGPSAALLDKVRALDALPRLGELRTLDLKGNDIRTGIQYIAQVLKRNRTLKVLNISENKIDVNGLVAIAEALKYNLTLETLDLSRNPCSGPSLDGIQSLRTAFTLNTSLKRLFLSSTALTSSGAIALAEFLPESSSLLHLDLTVNNLDIAGVMALSEGLKANHVMRCLDVNIPPDDEEFARMCRDILNTCVRNTEEAEKASQAAISGRGMGKGVWGMIEESELAKTFKKDDGKKADEDYVAQAKVCQNELEQLLKKVQATPSLSVYDTSLANDLISRSKAALVFLGDVIQTIEDPIQIEELFFVNDSISGLLTQIEEVWSRRGTLVNGNGNGNGNVGRSSLQGTKLNLKLNGLRLQIPDSLDDEAPVNSDVSSPSKSGSGSGVVIAVNGNDGDEEEVAETPRVDKGKGRAEPEPEVIEKVLSPGANFVLSESDEEEEEKRAAALAELGLDGMDVVGGGGGPSPIDLSKVMVEEEGEVFRKGSVLLGPEEMEGEYDGEELRIELLEAQVERPPPRALNIDEFGMELPPLPMSPDVDGLRSPSVGVGSLRSPISGSVLSPSSPHEPVAVAVKPPPKPYLRRSRSSSSSLNNSAITTTTTTTTSGNPSSALAHASPLRSTTSLVEGSIKGTTIIEGVETPTPTPILVPSSTPGSPSTPGTPRSLTPNQNQVQSPSMSTPTSSTNSSLSYFPRQRTLAASTSPVQ